MAITFIQQKKRQKYLLIALLVVFIVMLFVLWKGFLVKDGKQELIIQSSKNIELRYDILSGEALENLQSSGGDIILPENIGKRNPFL